MMRHMKEIYLRDKQAIFKELDSQYFGVLECHVQAPFAQCQMLCCSTRPCSTDATPNFHLS